MKLYVTLFIALFISACESDPPTEPNLPVEKSVFSAIIDGEQLDDSDLRHMKSTISQDKSSLQAEFLMENGSVIFIDLFEFEVGKEVELDGNNFGMLRDLRNTLFETGVKMIGNDYKGSVTVKDIDFDAGTYDLSFNFSAVNWDAKEIQVENVVLEKAPVDEIVEIATGTARFNVGSATVNYEYVGKSNINNTPELNISVYNNPIDRFGVQIRISSLDTGLYLVNSSLNRGLIMNYRNEKGEYYQAIEGEFHLRRFEASTRNVVATFKGKFFNISGKTVQINSGSFDLELPLD